MNKQQIIKKIIMNISESINEDCDEHAGTIIKIDSTDRFIGYMLKDKAIDKRVSKYLKNKFGIKAYIKLEIYECTNGDYEYTFIVRNIERIE